MATRGRPASLATAELSEDVRGQNNKSAKERLVEHRAVGGIYLGGFRGFGRIA